MRALISVVNREGLTEVARQLQAMGAAIFSTDGTRKVLQRAGIMANPLSELTHVPEQASDRIDMLQPALLNALLSHQGQRKRERQQMIPLDVVVVNLAAFVPMTDWQESMLTEMEEQIDVGGLTLLHLAARNFRDVVVLVRPEDYAPTMQEWREQGEVSQETRRRLAAIAFQASACYTTAIAEYLRGPQERFPEQLTISLERIQPLRYGENPHQQAAFYRWSDRVPALSLPTVAGATVLQGKELSYNNLLDLDAALTAVQSFSAPTVAIVKHTNPCGLACDDVLAEAYKKAHAGDPISAYGGVLGSNRAIDESTARALSPLFYEAIIAPEFAPAALALLHEKKNMRLLATHRSADPQRTNAQLLHAGRLEVRSIGGGLLLQTPDVVGDGEATYRVVTDREPTLEEVTDLMFAWKVVRCVKSNAIVLAHKLMLVGVGAGQMNRATSVQLAVDKAGERARGAVLASDAFFPFADGVEAAARAGVTAMIQPGGSIRDEETIRMANRYAIAMIFTGKRHFRH